jgi:hypothetical protein
MRSAEMREVPWLGVPQDLKMAVCLKQASTNICKSGILLERLCNSTAEKFRSRLCIYVMMLSSITLPPGV